MFCFLCVMVISPHVDGFKIENRNQDLIILFYILFFLKLLLPPHSTQWLG